MPRWSLAAKRRGRRESFPVRRDIKVIKRIMVVFDLGNLCSFPKRKLEMVISFLVKYKMKNQWLQSPVTTGPNVCQRLFFGSIFITVTDRWID